MRGVGMNLRVVTLNLWGTEAPLETRLALAAEQLRELRPDVVALQEVRPLPGMGPERTTAHWLADELSLVAHYRPALTWSEGAFGSGEPAGQEGLALLTRFDAAQLTATTLPEARPDETRILLSAELKTPAGPIWLHTTHLHYRLADGLAREAQVLACDAHITACGRQNESAPQIFCGDFNATPDADEMRFLRGLTTLGGRRTHFQDAWLTRPEFESDGARAGLTWSSDNEQTRPLRSLDIDRRIDYIYVTSRKRDGRGTIHRCRVVLTRRVGEGRESLCASDHYGVMADVQIGVAQRRPA